MTCYFKIYRAACAGYKKKYKEKVKSKNPSKTLVDELEVMFCVICDDIRMYYYSDFSRILFTLGKGRSCVYFYVHKF